MILSILRNAFQLKELEIQRSVLPFIRLFISYSECYRVSLETFSFTLMRLLVESSVVYTCYLSNFAGAKWVSRREQHFIFH